MGAVMNGVASRVNSGALDSDGVTARATVGKREAL